MSQPDYEDRETDGCRGLLEVAIAVCAIIFLLVMCDKAHGATVPDLAQQIVEAHESEAMQYRAALAALDQQVTDLTAALAAARADVTERDATIRGLEARIVELDKLLAGPPIIIQPADPYPPLAPDAIEWRVPDDIPTLADALSKVRHGYGDRILLKRGTSHAGAWIQAGGASETAPLLIGAYGTGPRPIIRLVDSFIAVSGPSGEFANHVWLCDLQIERDAGTTSESGVRTHRMGKDLRVERCRFVRCGLVVVNIDATKRIDGVRVVDTSLAYANSTTSHSEAVYLSAVDNWLFQNVLVLRNGYDHLTGVGRTTFDQGIYVHASSGHGVCRGLVTIENAASGVQFRSPATVDGVISIGNYYGINLGRGGSKYRAGGVTINAKRLFVADPATLDGKNGQGFDVANLLPGSTIEDVTSFAWIDVAGKDTDGLAGCHAAWKRVYAPSLRWTGPDSGYVGASITDSQIGVMSWRDGSGIAPPSLARVNMTTGAAARPYKPLPAGWIDEAEQRWGEPGYSFESAWELLTQ